MMMDELGTAIKSGNEEMLRRCRIPSVKLAGGQQTAIGFAMFLPSPRAVEILLERGADPNEPTVWGNQEGLMAPPLFWAVRLMGSCCSDLKSVANILIAKRESPNDGLQSTNMTPLHVAAMAGNQEMTHKLIEADGDLNAVTRNGYSAFMFALTSNDSDGTP